MNPSAALVPFRNTMLRCFPASMLDMLQKHLLPVNLELHHTLQSAEEPAQNVYFLESGICSMVVTMKDGRTVETAIVGRENFVGIHAILDGGRAPHRAFMQVAGTGNKINAAILREHLNEPSGGLRRCLWRGIEALYIQTAQIAACNRVHEVEERLARWLLMCQDRVDGDHIPITHEFLATMLGTRRSTVTLAAGILQKADLIDYRRGHVTIKNRKGLEDTACECLSAIREEYARLGLG
jgi:CRP-like cAMP-binding protein